MGDMPEKKWMEVTGEGMNNGMKVCMDIDMVKVCRYGIGKIY